jgi:hypothetical protein
MQVFVPNQQEELLVPLRGRCWEEGIYLSGPSYPPPPEDPFMERQLAAAAAASGYPGARPPHVSPVPRELTLDFPDALCLGETATTSFEVGSLKSAAMGGAAGEFALDDLPAAAKEAGWAIDPIKQPLAVGDRKPIQVTI